MLRALLLLLLLANGLLLALRQGWLGPGWGASGEAEREPLRLQRQVSPQLVRVLPPAAASAVLSATAASAAAAAAEADRQCLEAGPFGPADTGLAERALREAAVPELQWQAIPVDDNGAFMLYMGRYTESGAVQRKLDELQRLNLAGEPLPEGHPMAPGIDLGHFDTRTAADAALARIGRDGVRTARVVNVRVPQRQTRLRAPLADASLREKLAALKLPNGGAFAACPEPAASTPPPTASAAR